VVSVKAGKSSAAERAWRALSLDPRDRRVSNNDWHQPRTLVDDKLSLPKDRQSMRHPTYCVGLSFSNRSGVSRSGASGDPYSVSSRASLARAIRDCAAEMTGGEFKTILTISKNS
jgi:hypothetical protein